MIYGKRIFFNQSVPETTTDTSSTTVAEYAELLDGFNTICAVAEVTHNDGLLDVYADLLNESLEVSLNEGANSEYTDAFTKCFKEYKDSMSKGREFFKDKKFKQAKEKFSNASKACDQMVKEFEKVKSDNVLSALIGWVLAKFILAIQNTVVIVGTVIAFYIPIVGAVSGNIVSITTQVAVSVKKAEVVKSQLNDLLVKKDYAKGFNFYKHQLEGTAKALKELADMCVKMCDECAKAK